MQEKNSATTEIAGVPTEKSSTAAYYAVAMLTVIYSLNFLDRTVITILIDPIKRDYHLSDKMMGFISGFGFVIMYSILAAPVARWADRSNRRSIITDRKSTRLNSSHPSISYAVFCLKKKKNKRS